MSISPADAAVNTQQTTAPAAVPSPASTSQPEVGLLAVVIVLLWIVVALVLGKLIGVFRRGSILGPERLHREDSAWMLIATVFGSYFIGIVAGSSIGARLHAADDVKTLALTVIVGGVAVPFILAGLHFVCRNGLAAFGLTLRRLPLGFVGGLLCVFILYPLVMVMSELTSLVINYFQLRQPSAHQLLQGLANWHNPWLIALAIFVAVIVAPVLEEIAFRGVLQTCLVRLFGWGLAALTAAPPQAVTVPESTAAATGAQAILNYETPRATATIAATPIVRWLAVIVTAATFAAIHREPAFFPPLFVLALGLGYAYERTGNLWITMTTHAVFNSLQIVLFLKWGRG